MVNLWGVWGLKKQQHSGGAELMARTSSLLDCLALLALRVDMPASLTALCADSSLGLGMAEGLSVNGI